MRNVPFHPLRRFAAQCVFYFLLSTLAFGAGSMLLLGAGNNASGTASITVGTDWPNVSCNNVAGCSVNSATETLTVPSGNGGVVKFTLLHGGLGSSFKYSKNGGAFTTFVNNDTLSVANGDTLQFQMNGLACSAPGGNTETVTVTDNNTTQTVGSFKGTNNALC